MYTISRIQVINYILHSFDNDALCRFSGIKPRKSNKQYTLDTDF